ncbi:MAG: hypothetical protein WDZ51_06115 [Pirellulaceae bacterium]
MDVEKYVNDELQKLEDAEFQSLANDIEDPRIKAKYQKAVLRMQGGCGTANWWWSEGYYEWELTGNNCTGGGTPVPPSGIGSFPGETDTTDCHCCGSADWLFIGYPQRWQLQSNNCTNGGEPLMPEHDAGLYATATTNCDCGEEEEEEGGGYYYYYDDEDDCTDCTGQACDDYPKLDSTANYQVFSDGPQTSNHTTVEATKVTQRILCATPSVDFPACASFYSGKFICHSAMQLRGTLNIPPKCIIDHAHLRILASEEQQGLQTGDGTASIAASIENPNQSQTLIQLAQLENHCLWRDVPEFTSGNYYNTSNIAPAIQDIVDLDDWNDNELGDDFSLILSPKFFATDGGRYFGETVLHIYWHREVEEEGDGGVVCGGSAPVNHISQVDSTGGLLAGGSAHLNITTNDVGGFGGILAGGSAIVILAGSIYHENGTGGAVAGGSALNELIISSYESFDYRRKITIPSSSISADLENFYIGISLEVDPDNVYHDNDFQITDLDDNIISHELRHYADGLVIVFFKSSLSSSSDNEFWFYYGGNK